MDVRCPFCGGNLPVGDNQATGMVRCPDCRAEVDVGAAILFGESAAGLGLGGPDAGASGAESFPADPEPQKPGRSTDAYLRDEAPPAPAVPVEDAAPKVQAPSIGTVETVGSYSFRSTDLVQAKEVVFREDDVFAPADGAKAAARGRRSDAAPRTEALGSPPGGFPPPPSPPPSRSRFTTPPDRPAAPPPVERPAWKQPAPPPRPPEAPPKAAPAPERVVARPPSERMKSRMTPEPPRAAPSPSPWTPPGEASDLLSTAAWGTPSREPDRPAPADTAPPWSWEPPPAADAAPGEARAPSILDFDLSAPPPSAPKPPSPEPEPLPSTRGPDRSAQPDTLGLPDIDLSFDDLLGMPAGTSPVAPTGPTAPMDPFDTGASGLQRSGASGLHSLDLDAALHEESVPDGVLPWRGSPDASGRPTAPLQGADGMGSTSPTARMADDLGFDLDLGLPDAWPAGGGSSPAAGTPPGVSDDAPFAAPGASTELGLDFGANLLDVDKGAAPPSLEPPAGLGAAPAAAVGAPSTVRQPRTRKPAFRVVLMGIVLLALVGAILGQTDYGYFGINLFMGGGKGGRGTTGYRPPPAAAGQASHDTAEAFSADVGRLERAIQEDDKNVELRVQLLETLLHFRDRCPSGFAASPRLEGRLKQLRAQVGLTGAKGELAKVYDLVNEGKFEDARPILDGLLASGTQDDDIPYLYGKVALGQQKADEALKYFDVAAGKDPTSVAIRYAMARAYLLKKDVGRARTSLEEVLSREPENLAAKVLLAELALDGANPDATLKLAQEVVAKASAGSDSEQLFQAHLMLARAYEMKGAAEDRLSELKAALSVKPDHEETAVLASRLLAAAGKKDEALDILDPCRQKGCAGEAFLSTFAEAAFGAGKDDLADKALKEGVEKHPKSAAFPLIRGRHLLDQKLPRGAISALEEALKIDPGSVPGNILMAQALAKEGKLSEAVARLKQGLDQAKDSVPLLLALAGIQSEQKDWAAAEASLRRAVELDPSNAPAQQDLGLVVLKLGRADEAARILGALDAKNALNRAGSLSLANAYLLMHEPAKARDLLARIFARSEGDADVAAEYGRALIEVGSFQRAEEVLKKVAAERPTHALTQYYLGRLAMKTGEKMKAAEALARAVNLDGGNQKFRLELARALVAMGSVDAARDARVHLDTVITAYSRNEVHPDEREADAYLLRGKMLFDDQKYAQALRDFEAALAVSPTRTDIMIGFGRTLFEMARYSEAAPYLRQVLARDPSHAEANFLLGRILIRENKPVEAKAMLQRCVQRDARAFPEAHRMLGLIYRDEGLAQLARRSFASYLEYAPKDTSEAEEVKRMMERMK